MTATVIQVQGSHLIVLGSLFMNELRELAVRLGQPVEEDPAGPSKPSSSKGGIKPLRRMRLAAVNPSESDALNSSTSGMGGASAAGSPALPSDENETKPAFALSRPGPETPPDASERLLLLQRQLIEAERGDPPEPCQEWLIDIKFVPDLLMVWEACMVSHLKWITGKVH